MCKAKKIISSISNEWQIKQHEEEGIVYFDEPFVLRIGLFGVQHVDSDYIFSNRDYDREEETVVAYAKEEKDNQHLHTIQKKLYPTFRVQIHAGDWLINGI